MRQENGRNSDGDEDDEGDDDAAAAEHCFRGGRPDCGPYLVITVNSGSIAQMGKGLSPSQPQSSGEVGLSLKHRTCGTS